MAHADLTYFSESLRPTKSWKCDRARVNFEPTFHNSAGGSQLRVGAARPLFSRWQRRKCDGARERPSLAGSHLSLLWSAVSLPFPRLKKRQDSGSE